MKISEKELARLTVANILVGVQKTMMFKQLNGFGGRAKKPLAQVLGRRLEQIRSTMPGQLGVFFEQWLEPACFAAWSGSDAASEGGPRPRKRVYTPAVTFGAMLGQCLRGGSLREAVAEVSADRLRQGLSAPSPQTSSYSEARARLPLRCIHRAHQHLLSKAPPGEVLVEGMRVLAVDGTGVQLADTASNQDHFPQPSNQAPGCGFPVMHLVGLFELDRGLMLDLAHGPLGAGESGLFQTELMPQLGAGDLLVADRGFCSFYHGAALRAQGAHLLARLHGKRDWPQAADGNDVRVTWTRPRRCDLPSHLTDEECAALPDELEVRYVRYRLEAPGEHARTVVIATTHFELSVAQIAALYHRRWSIELSFDDLKTTLGMDFVDAQSPTMAWKLVLVYQIVHNLLRLLLLQAAQLPGAPPSHRLSFKGALDRLRHCLIAMTAATSSVRRRLYGGLLAAIALDRLPHRPGRQEPRVLKRRPKHFPKMNRPRKALRAPSFAPKFA